MPSSSYTAIDVMFDNDGENPTPVVSPTVKVYDVTHSVALDDLAADENGHVPSGTLPVAAGTLIRYSVSLADGRSGYAEELTT